MTRWPAPDRAVIARYLADLRLRSTNSRTYYRQVLHGFQDVAERYATLDREVLLAWLKNRLPGGLRRPCCTAPVSSTGSSIT